MPSSRSRAPALALLAMALDGLGCAMTRASQSFLIEQALCRAHYAQIKPDVISPAGKIPEALCKNDALQSQVAFFAASLDFSTLIICALVGPIYTRLASIVGKRNVLLLNTTSYALRVAWYASVFYFHNGIPDVRWVFLSCFFDLFGGGVPMRETLLYLYLAESVPGDSMMGTFNLLTATLIGTMSLGTFIAASLLNVNVFITCSLILGVYTVLVPLVAVFPRDDAVPKRVDDTENEATFDDDALASSTLSISSRDPLMGRQSSPVEPRSTTKAPASTMFGVLLRAATVDLWLSIELVVQTVQHPDTRPVMLLYFGTTLSSCIAMTTPQWASNAFHTGFASIDKITAMEQIVSAMTLLALPVLARYLLRPRLRSGGAVNFCVIVGSLMASLAGSVVVASAPSLTTYAFGVAIGAAGVGLSDALRSLATSAVAKKELVERLYISIRTVQTIAAVVGTPLWSGSLMWLLRHPNFSLGWMYMEYAGMILICLLLTTLLPRAG